MSMFWPRTRTVVGVALLALVAAALVPAPAHAQDGVPPLSAELVERADEFDGTTITFEGEAIGEVMYRGDHAWVHVNDDAYKARNVEEGAALGGYNTGQAFWVPADMARKIEICGDYHHEGDTVRIVGVFNAACSEHGGDMDIHATAVEVVTPGHHVNDPIEYWKWYLAALSVLGTGLSFAWFRRSGE
ncbi:MAG: hypothetical protein Q8K99_12310 [Actinomycetota bacterium]|nr:hypothetical protein [Actinomycetota bacterium]